MGKNNKKKDNNTHTILGQSDLKKAEADLKDNKLLKAYPVRSNYQTDPEYQGQKFFAYSFIPSKGAKADDKGLYGLIKFRGSFTTEQEMNERTLHLLKYVDSYHSMYQGFVGKWMPVTAGSEYSSEVSEVDLQKDIKEIVSLDMKEKREQEKRELNEIKEREEQLLKESKETTEHPYDRYIVANTKRANLTFVILDVKQKIKEYQKSLMNTMEEIKQMDDEYPDFKHTYINKYKEERAKAGISDGDEQDLLKFLIIEPPEETFTSPYKVDPDDSLNEPLDNNKMNKEKECSSENQNDISCANDVKEDCSISLENNGLNDDIIEDCCFSRQMSTM